MFKPLINITSRINYYSRIKATLSISNQKYPSFPSLSSDLFKKRIWMVFTNSKIRNNSWDEKKSSLKVQKYIQDYKPQSGISVIPSTQNHVLKVLDFFTLLNIIMYSTISRLFSFFHYQILDFTYRIEINFIISIMLSIKWLDWGNQSKSCWKKVVLVNVNAINFILNFFL